MRKLPNDIIDEMETRFGSDTKAAHNLLAEYLAENDYLDTDRIIRCVIFLSDNGLASFKSYLESAKGDPRDVMWWAEYGNGDSLEQNKRIRNFDKSFKEN